MPPANNSAENTEDNAPESGETTEITIAPTVEAPPAEVLSLDSANIDPTVDTADDMASALEAARAEMSSLRAQLAEAAKERQALEAARAEAASLRKQLKEASEERDALSTSFRAELEAMMDSHISQAHNLRAEAGAARAQRDAVYSSLKAAQTENTKLRKRFKASEELRVRQRKMHNTRTPKERMLRRAFTRKMEALALTHARTTARMLNVQKRCFEEELESLEAEAHATVVAFERQFAALRDDVAAKDEEHARERDAAYAKTAAVMAAVKKRIERADARLAAAERQRDAAAGAAQQRHALLESLARDRAAARSYADSARSELSRKNRLVDRLQAELTAATAALAEARESNERVVGRTTPSTRLGRARRLTAPPNAQELGNIFASVIADFANAQVNDDSDGSQSDTAEDQEVGHAPLLVSGIATAHA